MQDKDIIRYEGGSILYDNDNVTVCNIIDDNYIKGLDNENTYQLNFLYCHDKKTISNLNFIKKVMLNNCHNLKNIFNIKLLIILTINQCKKLKHLGNCTLIEILNLHDGTNIKDVGEMRQLKEIHIYYDLQELKGIYLLKNLKCISININSYSKIERQIKKLKKINPYINIIFIDEID